MTNKKLFNDLRNKRHRKGTELGLTIIEQIIYAMTDVNMIVEIWAYFAFNIFINVIALNASVFIYCSVIVSKNDGEEQKQLI